MVTLNTDSLLVGRLVPIVATEDTIEVLGHCAACGDIIDADTTAVFDWVNKVMIHKRSNGSSCVPLYIAQFIASNRTVSVIATMIIFGVSRRTIMRCRARAKGNA